MRKKIQLIGLSLFSILTMSGCFKDIAAIAKQARDIAIGVVLTDLPAPANAPLIDPAKIKRREAAQKCTQLLELEKKAVLIFVDKNAGQTRDGKGWKTALRSVAHGVETAFLKRADLSNQGKKIYVLVAGGTYNFDHEDAELKNVGFAGGLGGNGAILRFHYLGLSQRMADIEVIGGYASNDLCLEDDVNKILNEGKNNQRLTVIDGQNKSNHVAFFTGDAQAKNLALRRMTIKGGHAQIVMGKLMGGSIFVRSYAVNGISHITFEDLIVEGQSNGDGGCIGLRNAQNISLENVQFSNCRAVGNGGGLAISGKGTKAIQIKNSGFAGTNTAGGDGGCVDLRNTKNISLENVRFANCRATANGGGLAITGNATDDIKINNCTFTGTNSAGAFGGGIAVSQIGLNVAPALMAGPAIFTAAMTPRVHFKNTTITDAQANLGGGLMLTDQVERIKFEGGSISNNRAAMGSGITLLNQVNYVEFSDLTIEGNKGDNGVYLITQVKNLSFQGCKIRDNHAPGTDGGGIRADQVDGLWLKKVSFDANSSGANGGGLNLDGGTDLFLEELEFLNNKATGNGGGLHVMSPLSIKLAKCKFINNTATLDGGGASFSNCHEISIRGTPAELTTFEDNRARNGGHIHVGGLQRALRIKNAMLKRGIAQQDGGGISATATGAPLTQIVLDNVRILGGRAQGAGGAANFDRFNDIIIRNQSYFANNEAQLGGGGLYIKRIANSIDINRAQFFTNNALNDDGGALFVDAALRVQLAHTEVMGNGAVRNGGGIYLKRVADVVMDHVQLSNNTVRENGGNAYVEFRDQLTIRNSRISEGTARNGGIGPSNAGGLFARGFGAGPRKLELDHVTIANNQVVGGAVCTGAAGVYGDDLGFVELKTSHFLDNTVVNPAAGSNCAGAMKLFNLIAQPNALIVDSTAGMLDVKRNQVIGAAQADILANRIHGAILIPAAVHTGANYTTNPVVLNAYANKPFTVEANTPMLDKLTKPAFGVVGGGIPVTVYGENNREIVVSMYN